MKISRKLKIGVPLPDFLYFPSSPSVTMKMPEPEERVEKTSANIYAYAMLEGREKGEWKGGIRYEWNALRPHFSDHLLRLLLLALTPLLSCSLFYFSYLVFFLDLFLSFFCPPKIRLLARTSSTVCICILQNRSLDFTGTLRSLNWNLKAATCAWSALHDVRASYFTFSAPPKLPFVLLLESSAERSGLFAGLSSFRFRIMLFFHTLPFDSPLLYLCTYNISTFYEIQSLYWYN